MTAAALETLKTEMQQTAFITFMVMNHPEMGRLETSAIAHSETASQTDHYRGKPIE